jgi:hypothetical protein
MLSKQPAELPLSDAQAVGELIDTALIECARSMSANALDTVFDVPRQRQTLAPFPADSAGMGGSQRRAPLRPSRRTSCFPVSASVPGRSDGNRPAWS